MKRGRLSFRRKGFKSYTRTKGVLEEVPAEKKGVGLPASFS